MTHDPRRTGPMDVPARPRARVPRSFGTVALGGAVLAAVIIAVAASLYFRYLHYERVAARHVPAGTVLAIRIEVERVDLYEPVRRHLLPLLGGPGRPPAEELAALERLEERTGLKRGDLREILVARGAIRSDWVVVLGGIFPRGTSIAVLAAALAAEDPAWTPSMDATEVVHATTGVAVTRATDGAVVIASSRELAARAREPGGTSEKLGLPGTGAGALAMGPEGVRELATWPSMLADDALSTGLNGITALHADVLLGERPSVRVTLTEDQRGAASAVVARGLALAKAADSGSPVGTLLRAGAQRATVPPPAQGTASCVLVWERPEVDQWFQLLSDAIQDCWR